MQSRTEACGPSPDSKGSTSPPALGPMNLSLPRWERPAALGSPCSRDLSLESCLVLRPGRLAEHGLIPHGGCPRTVRWSGGGVFPKGGAPKEEGARAGQGRSSPRSPVLHRYPHPWLWHPVFREPAKNPPLFSSESPHLGLETPLPPSVMLAELKGLCALAWTVRAPVPWAHQSPQCRGLPVSSGRGWEGPMGLRQVHPSAPCRWAWLPRHGPEGPLLKEGETRDQPPGLWGLEQAMPPSPHPAPTLRGCESYGICSSPKS